MNKAKIKKTIEEGILDLCAKDIAEFISNNNIQGARSAGKSLGVPQEEIDKIVQEHKNGKFIND